MHNHNSLLLTKGLCNRFHYVYGPIDRTSEANKEADKIFASDLKSKLFTNQKKAKKRVEEAKQEGRQGFYEASCPRCQDTGKQNSTKIPLAPPLVVQFFL